MKLVQGADQVSLELYDLALMREVIDKTRHAPTAGRSAIVVPTPGFRFSHPQYVPQRIVEGLGGFGTDEGEVAQARVNVDEQRIFRPLQPHLPALLTAQPFVSTELFRLSALFCWAGSHWLASLSPSGTLAAGRC